MDSLKEIASEINKREKFIILGHVDPDGDCIGSVFAMKMILDSLNKKSIIILNDFAIDEFEFLISDEFELLDEIDKEKYNNREYTVIALDAGNRERLGSSAEKLLKDKFIINIDHHPDNSHFGDLNFIDSKKAAVGQIIYELASILNCEIDSIIGTAIATAILSDTGGLRYKNTTVSVLKIITNMIEKGIDFYSINKELFGNYKFSAVKLKGLALATLERSKNGKIAWLYIDQDMMEKTETDDKDAGGFVNFARDIKDVKVGISFLEAENEKIKVSFRSNTNNISVNKIASLFDGGGHTRAAGCILEDNLKNAIKRIINEVEKVV